MYQYIDNAESTAAAPRAEAGGTLTVAAGHGDRFGSPTPSSPLRVSVLKSDRTPKTILKIVGRTGDDLDVDGTADGKPDAAVEVGDIVFAGWTAGSIQEIRGEIAAKADDSSVAHLAGSETITGAKTFEGSATVKGGLSIHNSVGAEVSGFDADGFGFTRTIPFRLGRLVDLAAGTNLISGGMVPFAGKVVKVQIRAATNGASGGFAIQINRGGTTPLFASAYAVAASDTATKTITSFAADSVAASDWFSIDASSVGAGVQDVEVAVTVLMGNR